MPSPFETEFAHAWAAPGHTRYQLPDTDINQVLQARYTTGKPLIFTRGMLWDIEVRKAAHPGTYIPLVVRAGSDRSWNRHHGDGGEYLDRCSMQRRWLNPHHYELILERAFLNHDEQKVTFLGVPELTDADGTPLPAGTGQPLFHVEHSVGGTELQPTNRWRIVHLTDAADDRLTEPRPANRFAGQPERASADSQARPGPRLPTLRPDHRKTAQAGPEALPTSSLSTMKVK